ncbi:MAG: NAD(P)-dependent alcohol dehydrogenase [Bacteroidota bacterium]
MRAVIYSKYGGPEVLKMHKIDKPHPKEKEVLVKVYATTVTSGDVRLRSSNFPPLLWLPARILFGLFKPKKKILGHEFSGIVEEIGSNVTQFEVGDEVFGTTTMLRTGAYAEYLCLPESWKHGVLAIKPENATFEEAASLPIGGMTAVSLLEKSALKENQSIIVYGASGSVGSYALQVAKYRGAKITGVCSTSNLDMIHSLGATTTLDYTKQDITKLEFKYDVFFDAVGKVSKRNAKKLLERNGTYVSVQMLTQEKTEYLIQLKHMFNEGRIRSYIDRTYSLKDISEAHTYVDTGRKRGNVVILVREQE